MYKCSNCESDNIVAYYPALVRRRQDGEYMYREGYDVEEERDPVRAECEDCLEITSVPDDWFVNA